MQLDHVQVVVAVGIEGLTVQGLDVIALHRGLADQLPVGLVVELERVEEHVVGRQEFRKPRTIPSVPRTTRSGVPTLVRATYDPGSVRAAEGQNAIGTRRSTSSSAAKRSGQA